MHNMELVINSRSPLRESITNRVSLITLVIAISISPRIPLDISMPGRRFDLRVEDLLLALILLIWLATISFRPRLYLTPLFKTIATYSLIVLVTTNIAVMTLGISPLKTLLYFLKELEYFLIFFIVANLIRSESDIRFLISTILIAGVFNAIWVAIQLNTGDFHSLFYVRRELSSAVYESEFLLESYGPHLIGEASPLSTGGFFSLAFFLALNSLLFYNSPKFRWLYGLLCVVFFSGVCLSFSRVSILGSLVGLAVLLFQASLRCRIKFAGFILIMLAIVTLAVNQLDVPIFTAGRLSLTAIEGSLAERTGEIWGPLLNEGQNRFFLGFGKGALGTLQNLEAKEAHNHYLRVFVESGFFGLIAFVWLLILIISLSVKMFKKSVRPIYKVVSGTALASTISLSLTALVQDAFTPVILNELWWVLIGLTMASWRVSAQTISRK